ncbi:T9SS type A sorting domain-containing protein [bacterium]|nr:T9SS type A sorting domain-containing protein [bacterium]
MKATRLTHTLVLFFLTSFFAQNAVAQNDWLPAWINKPPSPAQIGHPNRWMIPPLSYTGIAYDKWRDVLYVVHPDSSSSGATAPQYPRIYAWKASDGTPAMDVGRSAFPLVSGQGGELPVPLDTIASDNGFSRNRSFEFNRWSLYKIDLDDEGRIFACNLVVPLWDICILLPNAQCDPAYMNQGPFRIWRWDTPKANPRLVYATLNNSATAIGDKTSSEMTYARWGDAIDVIGKRSMYTPPSGPPYLVDSTRIYVCGGSYPTQPNWNAEVDVILADSRPELSRPDADVGNYKLEYRLAVRLLNMASGLAAHGVAATAVSLQHEVWMDGNPTLTTAALCVQHPTNPWPQTYHQLAVDDRYLSTLLTGPAGPIRYFELPEYGRKFLVVADGEPTGGLANVPNDNTTARIIDVTTPGSESILWTPTPKLGTNKLENNAAADNWIADVDYKLEYFSEQENPSAPGLHITLFVLMSNNGIAAYHSRSAFPVELTTLTAALEGKQVQLRWEVATESNNHGFEVQRSFNAGADWEVIGFVPGRGNSNAWKEYRFADAVTSTHRDVGLVRYRLRQVDNDGSETYSPTVDVRIDAPTGIALAQNYPNPFNPVTTISYQLPATGHVTLRLYNNLGEFVGTLVDGIRNAGMHYERISAADLPSGNYIYELNADGHTLRKTLTVMR